MLFCVSPCTFWTVQMRFMSSSCTPKNEYIHVLAEQWGREGGVCMCVCVCVIVGAATLKSTLEQQSEIDSQRECGGVGVALQSF